MSELKPPSPVKLIMSLIFHKKDIFESVLPKLIELFGEIDFISEILPFDHTDYYYSEMGKPLFRRLISFLNLILPDELPDIKIKTNNIEKEYAINGKRQINIDPGYITAERLVLATGKNYTHRVYLKDGVYADLTLIYQKGDFQALPWTYPDYASEPLKGLLKLVRKRYLEQRKRG
ncbi:MAG TPA: DUF4416 family protein [Candidatus Desulfofervidus auxilii]|uniref:DUF4416 family protein n=1 Tax=Desulfofervidus auxilii TaxID=1621989 RepID=A0A7C0U4I8_DESA2|nr:DUF4416 family protein [Candidatus Desulfofervidus auxilii]HDD45395.1 DUF4416 family protein [Candidatus Desulfofervidus auxilii]